MAFVTGYVALFIQGSYQATSDDIVEINQIKQAFQKYVSPRHIVNFNSLYYSKEQFQLLDPVYSIADTTMAGHRDRYFGVDDCFKDFPRLINRGNLEKVWKWEEFRCGKLKSLPRSYFIEPPFLHPSGYSYAFLAYRLGRSGYNNRLWVRNHLPFFHTLELKKVKETLGTLNGIFNILEKLDESELVQISKGKGTVLSNDYLFARLTYPKIFSILEYRIYDRESLDTFLKDSPYVLKNYRKGASCFYRDGNLCWEFNVKHIFSIANNSTLGFFLGLILIIGVVVRLLLVKIKNQRLEDEKRRLALRVLTHEFRTPVTSLLLLVERMGNHYEHLDENMQEVYLRINSEVHRLKRLTDTSRNYLKAEQNDRLLHLNFDEVPSINMFVEEILVPFWDSHGDDIQFEGLKQDHSAVFDTYWLGICIKNLVDNACIHGKFPVKVSLFEKEQGLFFRVEDQGKSDFENLNEMTEEFVKGNKSSGTGLGMNIVYKVVREMGGKLTLTHGPTTFEIKIPTKKVKE